MADPLWTPFVRLIKVGKRNRPLQRRMKIAHFRPCDILVVYHSNTNFNDDNPYRNNFPSHDMKRVNKHGSCLGLYRRWSGANVMHAEGTPGWFISNEWCCFSFLRYASFRPWISWVMIIMLAADTFHINSGVG